MEDEPLPKILEGHSDKVWCVAFSPDSTLLASASFDKTVCLWNLPSGDLNAELEGHERAVYSLAFSPDGQSIVTGSRDETVRTWSVANKQQVKILRSHSSSVRSVAWSPNGALIASGSYDKTIILWDAISSSTTKKLTGHRDWIWSVSFSQNGNKLASAGDKTAIIWDVDSGAALFKLTHSNAVLSVCFSHDDQCVVTGCEDKIVRMFNTSNGHEEKRFEGHTDYTNSVACSFDGSMIASGSYDKSVRLWDVASTKQLQKLDGHTNWVWSVAFSRDGKFIASGSNDNTVRLWNAPSSLPQKRYETPPQLEEDTSEKNINNHSDDEDDNKPSKKVKTEETNRSEAKRPSIDSAESDVLKKPKISISQEGDDKFTILLHELKGHTQVVRAVAFSPDGKLIASGGLDNTIRLWNLPNGEWNGEIKGHKGTVYSLAFSPDSKSIVTGSGDNAVRTWSVATKQQLETLNGHSGCVKSVAWSPNDVIASGSYDKTVILWDAASGSEKRKLTGHTGKIYSVSFSLTGEKVASGSSDKTAIIWDVNSGAALFNLTHSFSVWSVSFSNDDQFVVTGCGDKIVRTFFANTGREEKKFEGHTDLVISVAFSFDGSMIVSGSKDRSMRLWDVASAKQLQQFDHKNDVYAAFSCDGKLIASVNGKIIQLWKIPTKKTPVMSDWFPVSSPFKKYFNTTYSFASLARQLFGSGTLLTIVKVHEIPRRELTKEEAKLSEGKFGTVWRGTYNGIPVAIKEPKMCDAELNPKKQLADLIEQATVMTSISNHPNVLHCYGISRVGKDDCLLVTELCNLGSLDDFLQKNPETSAVDRRRFSQQVARGLNHLGKHNVAHRDVAARNVLLHDQEGVIVAKVCDFGLSRQCEGEDMVTGQHLLSSETAAEVITSKHSSPSDVWSFGVLLWEVESLCATRAKPDTQAFPPLSKPVEASDNMYEIMLKCWNEDPHERPSFEELIDMLA